MEGRIYKNCLEETAESPLADGTGAKLLGEMVAELLLGSAPGVTWRSGVTKLDLAISMGKSLLCGPTASSFLKTLPCSQGRCSRLREL